MKKRIILVGRHYIIEPLGLIYLAGLAKSIGWEVLVHLVKEGDFMSLFEEIKRFKPDMVGFTIWTGYHLKAFAACDSVRQMGIPVIIGGPHATYFTVECLRHADYVAKGEGFRTFRRILQGEVPSGIHFDPERVAEGFPNPERATLYDSYPELGQSPIKSIMASVGCPFTCSYCYAPVYNDMYDGFKLKVRPVDSVIDEALAIKARWPLSMIYFQDDIFGFSMKWLAEFTTKWRARVGVPWHCQIRLELTRDANRLDLFREGGCTGITLAIESGNAFLRESVLCRAMEDAIIMDGCGRIKERGLTLRTEQILAVPFSDISTDLGTLGLNCRLNPEMAWTSILAPYGGTAMGTIASNFGFYGGVNDDLQESFFDRSVLHQTFDGREVIEPVVDRLRKDKGDNPLLRMHAEKNSSLKVPIFIKEKCGMPVSSAKPLCEIEYLSSGDNDRYADQTVMLQRLFNWLSKVPDGQELGRRIVSGDKESWTWENVGRLATEHLEKKGYGPKLPAWSKALCEKMGYNSPLELPSVVRQNPNYFVFFAGGHFLAEKTVSQGLFNVEKGGSSFDKLGVLARRHLFMTSLYKIERVEPPIVDMVDV